MHLVGALDGEDEADAEQDENETALGPHQRRSVEHQGRRVEH